MRACRCRGLGPAPGIIHKNRTQTLTRDRAYESTLKSWEDKQRCEFPRPLTQYALQPEIVSEEEASQINLFGQAAGALIHSIREIAQSHHSMEQELAHAVNASSKAMDANSKSTGVCGAPVLPFFDTSQPSSSSTGVSKIRHAKCGRVPIFFGSYGIHAP
ncbi:unnamed protein product [Oncorhynchus mykiss]|uniref:Diacylglycerol kinase eta/delta/kappa helical domain-containing protein n=1 Tax=Oncorhynchus mykiss TaxID=8022 RepID=A0A060Z9S9_ONCMY|nr:unnamed protein product [Oncorhynchus mykiss]